MTLWKWSRTAASNGTADSTCPFPEGMSGAALNDGSRGQMAAIAKYRDDTAGAIVTGGSVNAYTVATYQGFDTLAHLDGAVIAFSPHITSTGAVQINVDSLGLKPYRPSPGVDFIGGELIQGTPYTGIYNNSTGEIYARGFMSSPYAVPVFGGMDFWDTIAPNSCFIFPAGQAISRSVYSRAFARWGTTYGAGDGSTTFNVPDKTGRASVMKEAVATRLTSAAGGVDGATMGATGGGQTQTLTAAQIPTITASNPSTVNGTFTSTQTDVARGAPNQAVPTTGTGGTAFSGSPTSGAITGVTSHGAGVIAVSSTNTGGQAHPIVQPTIVTNYIIRIL